MSFITIYEFMVFLYINIFFLSTSLNFMLCFNLYAKLTIFKKPFNDESFLRLIESLISMDDFNKEAQWPSLKTDQSHSIKIINFPFPFSNTYFQPLWHMYSLGLIYNSRFTRYFDYYFKKIFLYFENKIRRCAQKNRMPLVFHLKPDFISWTTFWEQYLTM